MTNATIQMIQDMTTGRIAGLMQSRDNLYPRMAKATGNELMQLGWELERLNKQLRALGAFQS